MFKQDYLNVFLKMQTNQSFVYVSCAALVISWGYTHNVAEGENQAADLYCVSDVSLLNHSPLFFISKSYKLK